MLRGCSWTRACGPRKFFESRLRTSIFPNARYFNPFGKTPAARRKLTMTEDVFCLLKARAAKGTSVYAFPSPDDPVRPIGSVRKAHNAAVRRAKIKSSFRLYDLR